MDRRRRDQDRRLLLTSVLLFALFAYDESSIVDVSTSASSDSSKPVIKKENYRAPTPFVPPTLPPVTEEEGEGINILCFGDSLTAGVIGIANQGASRFSPYAPHLESNLKKLQRKSKEGGIVRGVHVNHTGLPGYTSYDMIHPSENQPRNLNRTLNTFKREDGSSSLDMVIIMAGTNDLLYQKYFEYDLSESVISLHKLVLNEYRIPLTIAVDVPISRIFSTDDQVLQQIYTLSQGLQRFAESESRTTYVPFPFAPKEGEYWSKDGV